MTESGDPVTPTQRNLITTSDHSLELTPRLQVKKEIDIINKQTLDQEDPFKAINPDHDVQRSTLHKEI